MTYRRTGIHDQEILLLLFISASTPVMLDVVNEDFNIEFHPIYRGNRIESLLLAQSTKGPGEEITKVPSCQLLFSCVRSSTLYIHTQRHILWKSYDTGGRTLQNTLLAIRAIVYT